MNESAAVGQFVSALRTNNDLVAKTLHRSGDIRISTSLPEQQEKVPSLYVECEHTESLTKENTPIYESTFEICCAGKTRLQASQIADSFCSIIVPADSRTFFSFTGLGVVSKETRLVARHAVEYDKKGDKYDCLVHCLVVWYEGSCP